MTTRRAKIGCGNVEAGSRFILVTVVGVILLAGGSRRAAAESAGAETDTSQNHVAFGPYCGLRALYAALRYEGADVHFESLLNSKYLGSPSGSSLAELQQAVIDFGFHSVAINDVSPEMLSHLSHPLILHIKKSFNSKTYDHYVVCLRSVDGGVRVFDPPDPIETQSLQQVLARSDGVGLIVSPESDLEGQFIAFKEKRVATTGLAAFVVCAVAAWYRSTTKSGFEAAHRMQVFRQSVRHAFLLALLAISIGLSVNIVRSDGLFSASGGDRILSDADAQIIDRDQLQNLLHQGMAIVVDARMPRDFSAGHIPGAINIPVDTNDTNRRQIMRTIALDAPVVVYCQSSVCPYSGLVIAGLRSDGYRNLRIYQGGWTDWISAQTAFASR